MKRIFTLLSLSLLANKAIQAQNILAQWTFDGTDSVAPFNAGVGSGTVSKSPTQSSLILTTATGFMGKKKGLNTTRYPARKDSSGQYGVHFAVSTVGKSGINVAWGERHSGSASGTVQLQYTTDGGTTWNPFPMNSSNITASNVGSPSYFELDFANNYILDTTPGSSGSSGWGLISANFASVAGVDNNPNFGFRISPVFRKPGDTSYVGTRITTNYSQNGSIRFDSVTVTFAGPVPVNFVRTQAALQASTIQVRWATESELNIAEYIVEGSKNGTDFSRWQSIPAKNVAGENNYLAEVPVAAKFSFFRIKAVEKSGKTFYSPVVSVTSTENNALQISPNPASNHINITSGLKGMITVVVTNLEGKQVLQQQVNAENGNIKLSVQALPAGWYNVNLIKNNNQKLTQSFQKL